MATTATPAGGSRNGTGPEWGGFEENIQVMASRPAALGAAVVRSVVGTLPRALEVCSICSTFPLLWVFVLTTVSGTSADLKGRTCTPARGPRVFGPTRFFSGSVGVTGSSALAKTILCAQSCLELGKTKEVGTLAVLWASIGKVGERHVWEAGSTRFLRLEKRENQGSEKEGVEENGMICGDSRPTPQSWKNKAPSPGMNRGT